MATSPSTLLDASPSRKTVVNIPPGPPYLALEKGARFSRTVIFNILQWTGWLIFGIFLFARAFRSWGLWGALLDSGIFLATGGLLTMGMRRIFRRMRHRGISHAVIAPCVLVACAVLAQLWFALELFIDRRSFDLLSTWPSTAPYFAYGVNHLAGVSYLITVGQWFIYVFALLIWSSLYFGINSFVELEYEKKRVSHALQLADSAQLKMLQSQLSPHFIFNALNGITTLIREKKRDTAARMVSTLSTYLRATLRTIDRPELTVSEELVFIDQYIELQQLRFPERLRFQLDVGEETFAALLPTLILQPLVEHAILHGALSQGSGGDIRIAIHRSEMFLRIAVEDSGKEVFRAGNPTSGISLTNTAERLYVLYGDSGTLSLEKSDSGGSAVVLLLPFREAPASKSLEGRLQ